MPAPSLAALLDFESQFESAAQAILASSGINAFISQHEAKLPPIATGISFDVGSAFDELTILPLGGQTVQQQQDFFRYQGSLTVEVSVSRDTSPDPANGAASFLGQVRALVRAAFMQSQWPFQDSNLPWLRVSQIRPDGTTSGFQQVRNVDIVSLRFAVDYAIQPSAWPAGFPPS